MPNMPEEKDIKKVVDEIKAAVVYEELCIPLYTSHIKQAFYWSGLPKDVRDEIVAGLKILEKDSRWHAEALRMVEKIYIKTNK